MRPDVKKTFYFQADAHSLGGSVQQPTHKMIPSQAHASLPSVGGHVTTTTEEFNHDSIVSCRRAYTRVSGREHQAEGPWSTLVTSVIEGLNILEVFTAERIVAQVSVEYSKEGKFPRVSFAGSHFDKLRFEGREIVPTMNERLLRPKPHEDGSGSHVPKEHFQQTSREQAHTITKASKSKNGSGWLADRFSWMDSDHKPGEDRWVLCSLVDGVDQVSPGKSFGHVVDIPNFGRLFLGEVLVHSTSIRLSMIRAELGCHVNGVMSAGVVTSGGLTVPP